MAESYSLTTIEVRCLPGPASRSLGVHHGLLSNGKQPDHEKKLKELGEVSSWQRAEVIEKGGWDKMPGQEKADYAVARGCADGLDLLIKK